MKRIVAVALGLLVGAMLGPIIPVLNLSAAQAAWTRVQVNGAQVCKDDATGVTFQPPFTRKADVTKACETLTSIPWLGTAAAAPLRLTLNCSGNPSAQCSTQYPCVQSDRSDCAPPTLPSLGWTQSCLDAALASQTTVEVGTAVDASVEACAIGTDVAAATLSVVLAVNGTSNCDTTNLSITGSTPNRKLHNSATGTGSGTCKLKLSYMGSSALSASFPWTNSNPPGTDTTPPTAVTGINCADGTLSVACTIDAQMDPGDAVARTGIASYKFYANGVYVDSLAAASPGLNCDFTAQTIGAAVGGSPSATQGTGASGAQWTVNARGYGTEAADSYYGVSCPASGSSVYGIARVDSVGAASTYNKAHVDIRNGTSTTAAHYDCNLMRVEQSGTSWYVQQTYRALDGGDNTNSALAISGSPPFYVRASVVSNTGECDYSSGGGTWIPAFAGTPITLNDSKIVAFGGSATPDGIADAAITVTYGSAAVETAGGLRKTLTVPAGTATYTATAVDVQGNESTALAGSSATASSVVSSGTAKKWHPGYYVMLPRDFGTRTNQSTRYSYYDREGSSAFTGWTYWTVWAQLEGATHGDYTAGDAMLHAELAHLRNEPVPKRLILAMDDELYRGTFSLYPQYLVDAGCVFQEVWTGNNATASLFHFKWWLPTCAQYYADLVTHLGAEFDSETNLETFILDYEQALSGNSVNGGNGSQFNRAGFMNGLTTVFTAAAAALPHTNLAWLGNWGITFHEADEVQEIGIAKPLGIGIGSEDACSIDPATNQNVYGTYPIYQDMQNVFAGYGGYDSGHHAGTYTDQRGAMFSTDGVEDSELGYQSVCNGTGFAGYATIGNGLRPTYMSLYDEWNAEWNTHARVEYNMETGTSVQQWDVGTTGSLWDLVTNHPLTHTACPTDYDTLFGNGSAGSGCDTSN